MTNDLSSHESSMPPSADPAQHPRAFARAFNSADPVAVEAMYEDAGVLVPEPGKPVSGAGRRAANSEFLGLGLPIEVALRHCYVAGDIALLIVDWSIGGVGPDGSAVDIRGTATDVARRGGDGAWRYIIDNPFGTA